MILNRDYVFTSESVSEGHPDKFSDQVSDGVLDLYLAGDNASKVACETLITTGKMIIAGEIHSQTRISKEDIEKRAREIALEIGYNSEDVGFDGNNASIDVLLHEQSADIHQGVVANQGLHQEEGAGDQGMMFGFAINETKSLMPMPLDYSHKILQNLATLRKEKTIAFLRPDAKSQVTVKYENGKPKEISKVVVSTQHDDGISHKDISEAVIEQCVKQVIDSSLLKNTEYYINPTGNFVIGGPHGDCGLTGRKIIVDTYGGMGRHGGGAFSGKDPSKVDRSAAYMMRYVAKNLVASGMAEACEIQVAYAIGVAKPMSIVVNTYGTGKISDEQFEKIIDEKFDLTPKGIREALGLRDIKYLPTASYGHFGREGDSFPWEKTNKANLFK